MTPTESGFAKCECRQGRFCAWGNKGSHDQVALWIDDRLVATEIVVGPDGEDRRKDISHGAPDPMVGCAQYPQWFISVPTAEVPTGSVIVADTRPDGIMVLRDGTAAQSSSFTVDGSVLYRSGSTNGDVGTGVGLVTMTRSVGKVDIAGHTEASPSRWSFGVRYDAALFDQDWVHRLAVVVDFDAIQNRHVSLTPGIALGGGLSAASTANNSTITAGFLYGFSLHFDWQVAWQIAAVIGGTVQGLSSNGNTLGLYSLYAGPRVGF
jgi:hypothetical protein